MKMLVSTYGKLAITIIAVLIGITFFWTGFGHNDSVPVQIATNALKYDKETTHKQTGYGSKKKEDIKNKTITQGTTLILKDNITVVPEREYTPEELFMDKDNPGKKLSGNISVYLLSVKKDQLSEDKLNELYNNIYLKDKTKTKYQSDLRKYNSLKRRFNKNN